MKFIINLGGQDYKVTIKKVKKDSGANSVDSDPEEETSSQWLELEEFLDHHNDPLSNDLIIDRCRYLACCPHRGGCDCRIPRYHNWR